MAENTETQEIQTITIGDKTYRSDSLTETGINLINDVKKIEEEQKRLNLQLSIASLAKQKILEVLAEETSKFTEVEVKTEEA